MTDTDEPVFLRVVSGAPTAEELAALVTVAAALRPCAAETEPTADTAARSSWSARAARPWGHGPGGWRASSLPH